MFEKKKKKGRRPVKDNLSLTAPTTEDLFTMIARKWAGIVVAKSVRRSGSDFRRIRLTVLDVVCVRLATSLIQARNIVRRQHIFLLNNCSIGQYPIVAMC